MKQKYSQKTLEAFFLEVADLTLNHDVLNSDYAVVYPSKLGAALEKVDPDWWKLVTDK